MKKLLFILGTAFLLNFSSFGIFNTHIFAASDTDKDPCPADSVDCIDLMVPFDGDKSLKISKETTDADGNATTAPMGAVQIMAKYVSSIYKFGLALVSIFSVIMIMIGGYEYMTAGGDSGNTDNAKKRIEQALFGLILVFLSALLLQFVNPTFFKIG